jgi:hypothetical protein
MDEPPQFNADTIPGPKFSVSFEFTDEIMLGAYRGAFARYMLRRCVSLMICCLFMCLIVGANVTSAAIGLLVVFVGFLILALDEFWGNSEWARRRLLRMEHRRYDFTFDEYGILAVSAVATSRLKWSAFVSITRGKHVWTLDFVRSGYPIPVSLMSPELQEFIVRKCSENGVKVR